MMKSLRLILATTTIAVVVSAVFLAWLGPPPQKGLWEAIHQDDRTEVVRNLRWLRGVNVRGAGFVTPLHWAAVVPSAELAAWLVAQGANVNAIDGNKESPLNWAAREGRLAAVEVLLAGGADPNGGSSYRGGALHIVVRRLQMQLLNRSQVHPYSGRLIIPDEDLLAMVRLLIKYGADCNDAYRGGKPPPLISAVRYWGPLDLWVELVECLLDGGANPNAANDRGKTVLHIAAVEAAPEIVSLLIRYGADVHAEDSEGETPLDYAIESHRADVASILRQASRVKTPGCNGPGKVNGRE